MFFLENIRNRIRKAWHDPVGSKVIAAGFVAIFATAYASFTGSWPTIQIWLKSDVSLPNWLAILLAAAVVLCTPFRILKFFSNAKDDIKKLLSNVGDDNFPISSLLREAITIAKRLDDKEFVEWADKELNGKFASLKEEDLPTYRRVYGELKAFNPYRGWEAVNFESAETREAFSYAPNGQDISSLEKISKPGQDRGLEFTHSPSQKQILIENIPMCTDVKLLIGHSQLMGILIAVRNKIYDWASDLEAA
jgi:hypothetical protein